MKGKYICVRQDNQTVCNLRLAWNRSPLDTVMSGLYILSHNKHFIMCDQR